MRLLNTTTSTRMGFAGALFCLCSLLSSSGIAQDSNSDQAIHGVWVVDPAQPGPSLPPTGRSLFDFLITDQLSDGTREYDIPFPYDRLIERLERQLRSTTPDMPAVKQVLFPLGRSLARNIARPDFFRFPRVVAAVDSPPAKTRSLADILYKDRLYIGYGEKANLLEVISYNEAAGRFEFQIVTDYKEGGDFKVFYANREVCSACHQNGALIFSRQQWDETNANPKIAALLKQQKRDYFGIPIERGVDIPNAIDDATNRANYFSLYQRLWQQGCSTNTDADDETQKADSADPQQDIQCRANILRYVLQYRLSGDAHFDNDNEYFKTKFLPGFTTNIQHRWPEGLLIPDPDIPNRDPLLMLSKNDQLTAVGDTFTSDASQVLNTMLKNNDVPSEFEPLNPRPALMTWQANPENINAFIRGLSDFLSINDIEALDQHLKLKAKIKNHVKSINELVCQAQQSKTEEGSTRVKFTCHSVVAETGPVIDIKGRFYVNKDDFLEGKLSQLDYAGAHYIDLKIDTNQILSSSSKHSASFDLMNGNLNLRLPNGNAVGKFILQWPASTASSDTLEASGQLNVLDDFSFIDTAINAMENDTLQHNGDALSDKPFRRVSIMSALSKSLILPGGDWCCLDDSGMPEAALDKPGNSETVVVQAAKPELSPFYRYCSLCHRTNQPMPPNFLQGDLTQVENNISHCAERIFFRLSMWQYDESQRSKSPMPPFTALEGLGLTYERWKTSDELTQLKHYIADVLTQQTGQAPDINAFIARGFDNLRTCLP